MIFLEEFKNFREVLVWHQQNSAVLVRISIRRLRESVGVFGLTCLTNDDSFNSQQYFYIHGKGKKKFKTFLYLSR